MARTVSTFLASTEFTFTLVVNRRSMAATTRLPKGLTEPTEEGAERALAEAPGSLRGELVFACLAFTPSLLPRSAVLQGVVCGISAAIGLDMVASRRGTGSGISPSSGGTTSVARSMLVSR